jgi:PAS domain S-box-containing protein
MKLRTKLLAGIQVILLLQILVTGGFTLRTLLLRTRSSTESELQKDWEQVRSSIESLKHILYTNIHQLVFFLQNPRLYGVSEDTQRGWIRYFISLTDADRAVMMDGDGHVLVDELAGIARPYGLSPGAIDPSHFRFPRNELIASEDTEGALRLFLVTGTTITLKDGGIRRLYLITNIDKARVDSINEKTGANIALFAGSRLIACTTAEFSLEAASFTPYSTIDIGNHPYKIFPKILSYDVPQGLYLISLASLLPERLTIQSVLFSYLTAFLITLAASLMFAMGITMLVISPFNRLNQWLHAYMGTGKVEALDIRSHDEVGFLAGAFHTMITNLIGEKHVISDQLEQIRSLNAYARSIMNDIKAAILVTSADGSIEFCNTYFLELTGARFEELDGAGFSDVLGRYFRLRPPNLKPEDFPLDREAAIEGLALEQPGREPMRLTAKISPIRLAGGRNGSLIVLEDITAAQRLWEKTMIADRVTLLGILSAGMAHEINNPLGSILSHVKYLKAVEGEREKLDSLSWIESETNRIAAIVQRIRAYSAPQPGKEPPADLNAAVRQTLEVLKITLEKRGLCARLDLEEGLPQVSCATDELKQVILNIVLNACQASPDGGIIGIASRGNSGGTVILRVEDNGTGIEPANLRNIFDPFFTTKGADGGGGLGLSICYAIVKRSGGDIRVESAPGKGTEVEVTLNVHERAYR